MDAFRFTLTPQEKEYLKDVVRQSIAAGLRRDTDWQPPEPPTAVLRQGLGAFVTLKRNGQLRGCIGHIMDEQPLYQTIAHMAQAAAFEDPRFPPLTQAEFADLDLEISILGPVTRCLDPAAIEVGRHGLIMRQGLRQGLLLPQVAVEWGWDRETFLAQTCRKANLAPNAWASPDTEIYAFEAEIV